MTQKNNFSPLILNMIFSPQSKIFKSWRFKLVMKNECNIRS